MTPSAAARAAVRIHELYEYRTMGQGSERGHMPEVRREWVRALQGICIPPICRACRNHCPYYDNGTQAQLDAAALECESLDSKEFEESARERAGMREEALGR